MIWGRKVLMMIKLFGVSNCKIGVETPIFLYFFVDSTTLCCILIIWLKWGERWNDAG